MLLIPLALVGAFLRLLNWRLEAQFAQYWTVLPCLFALWIQLLVVIATFWRHISSFELNDNLVNGIPHSLVFLTVLVMDIEMEGNMVLSEYERKSILKSKSCSRGYFLNLECWQLACISLAPCSRLKRDSLFISVLQFFWCQ